MIASLLTIAFCLGLLVYWFRYCCKLMLRNSQEELAAMPATSDTRFGVAGVIERLRTEEALDPLHQALDRDYQVFRYLVQHAAGLELASIEDWLLLVDYKLTKLWYRITLIAAPKQSREVLSQMASILNVLVSRLDRQAAENVEA